MHPFRARLEPFHRPPQHYRRQHRQQFAIDRQLGAECAADIVGETLKVTVSERGATRMDDRTSDASMERRKKEGYF